LRILTFTSLFPNALQPSHGVFVYQRVSHLARRAGNTVHVIAPVPYSPAWLPVSRWRKMGLVPRNERIGPLEVHHPRYALVPRVSMPAHGLCMYAGSLSLARRLHREIGFDCIDAHYVFPDGLAAVLLGRQLGLPVIVSARGTDINLFPSFRSIRGQIRWTLNSATGVVAVCEALKQAMVDLGIPGEKVRVIGNGIDSERFQPVDRESARLQLGIPADASVIVSVGALIPRKGYQLLIPAVAQLASRYPKLRIYIIGEGAYRKTLCTLAHQAGVADRVTFVGEWPNEGLKTWYSAADVSCLASAREGWANVILESLACGTPVVATRVWGAPEVIVSPELGVLVDQEIGSIAGGLEQALQKVWNSEQLVSYARARTWDLVAAQVNAFLESCDGVQGEQLAAPSLTSR
jgi:glycosyltransferase involved in cell wall biosynthesis